MSETAFRDPVAAVSALARISEIAGFEPNPNLFVEASAPDQALANLERWLRATSSPHLHLQQLVETPELGRLLILLLGASQPIADSLIQNPELASVLFDRSELAQIPARQNLERQGRALLGEATSYSHTLDRLRFLRQRWMLPIVVNDLGGAWPEPLVWKALSDLAEGLIALTLEAVWKDRALDGECPIMIVGFGKLGGSELNYSSDIDLVYVCRDGCEETRLSRVCEAVTRAFTEKMGRGQLYRVDLRLRPYGGTGPIVSPISAVESYYKLYAEPWEIQALLRAKPIAGPADLARRWEGMRKRHCFKPKLGSAALDESLAMRARTEAGASEQDIKRGRGGIRDVEFLVQILQMAHGYGKPALQVRPTLDALLGLESLGLLDHAVRISLESGYTFLRQLEHRIQFAQDRQTHDLPSDEGSRQRLARLMGCQDWNELSHALLLHRRTIGSLYQSTLHPHQEVSSNRALIAEKLGNLSQSGLQWFDVFPESELFYESLCENQHSLDRVHAMLQFAPRLVPSFKSSLPLTELLLSGEIDEDFDPASQLDELPLDCKPKQLADGFTAGWARCCARWVLDCCLAVPADFSQEGPRSEVQKSGLGCQLSSLTDALLRHCARRLYTEFDLIALGSYGIFDLSPDSDVDALLLLPSKGHHLDAETHAQFFLGLISQLKRLGAPIELDLRLRPDGGKGFLVRTYEGFGQYELEAMEMWERFALGQSRLVFGSEEALRLVVKSAYAQPLTPERLKELLAMKKRIETERVLPQHLRRDVKLGTGGLSDIEWFVHLHEMRYPTATKAGEQIRMDDRIRALGRAHLINAIEAEQLLEAHRHLVDVRIRLALQGLKKDLLPENPDKLDRLAQAGGYPSGNEFLKSHERVIDAVRAIYQEGLERLKA